jgi:hypothetical protein
MDKGEEIVATVKELCKTEGIKLGLVSGRNISTMEGEV